MAKRPGWIGGLVASAASLWKERDRLAGKTHSPERPTSRRVDAGTRIEYSPELDGDADPGEVVWTWVPFEDDPGKGKDRPVIVIGRSADRLAAVPLTSKNKGHGAVAIGSGAWDRSGRPSYAKVDQLILVCPGDVRREGAILDRRRFDDVVAAASRHHDLVAAS